MFLRSEYSIQDTKNSIFESSNPPKVLLSYESFLSLLQLMIPIEC